MGGVIVKVQVVKVDFDNFRERIDDAKRCIIHFLPCKVRISSGRNGLHIKKFCHNEIEYSYALSLKQKFDDPVRLKIDALRKEHGLIGDITFSVKCIDEEIKIAGEWVNFETESDVKNMEDLLI
jgi:hypothetical protein